MGRKPSRPVEGDGRRTSLQLLCLRHPEGAARLGLRRRNACVCASPLPRSQFAQSWRPPPWAARAADTRLHATDPRTEGRACRASWRTAWWGNGGDGLDGSSACWQIWVQVATWGWTKVLVGTQLASSAAQHPVCLRGHRRRHGATRRDATRHTSLEN